MDAVESILKNMLPDRIKIDSKNAHIFTPVNIAIDMIDMLSDKADIWNPDSTFLDPVCKSGIFLYEIYKKLMESPRLKQAYPDEQQRRQHILTKQLYGIAPSEMCKLLSIRTVYGQLIEDSNIITFDNYENIMRNEDKSFLNDKLKERFKTVQFDVVISNPPYNKGKDLDFVDLGYKLCKKYVVMITPAKWQTAKADQKISSRMKYGQFRKMYVPHMEKVVYYPDCLDVFGIQQSDGITYYLIDKISTYENNCNIINISNLNRYVNSRQTRDITNQQSLWNIGNDLVEALGGGYNTFKFQEISKRKEYTVNINTQMTKATGSSGVWDWDNSCIKPECVGKGGVLFRQDGSLVLTGGTKILLRNQQSSSNKSVDIFTSDSIDECNSFISWFDLKFIRFLALINLSALDIIDNNTFRFVPAPPSGKFDHIYTDEELYKAFNIPQKYIEVIEATIKERKK